MSSYLIQPLFEIEGVLLKPLRAMERLTGLQKITGVGE